MITCIKLVTKKKLWRLGRGFLRIYASWSNIFTMLMYSQHLFHGVLIMARGIPIKAKYNIIFLQRPLLLLKVTLHRRWARRCKQRPVRQLDALLHMAVAMELGLVDLWHGWHVRAQDWLGWDVVTTIGSADNGQWWRMTGNISERLTETGGCQSDDIATRLANQSDKNGWLEKFCWRITDSPSTQDVGWLFLDSRYQHEHWFWV